MKSLALLIVTTFFIVSCNQPIDKEAFKKEIFTTEKSFEKMAADSGIAAAFYFYADENAVINRGNDSLIFGKEQIKNYVSLKALYGSIQNSCVSLQTITPVSLPSHATCQYHFATHFFLLPIWEGVVLIEGFCKLASFRLRNR